MFRQRIVAWLVVLSMSLSGSMASLALAPQPANAQEDNAAQVCKAFAEEEPEAFEEFYGTHGACVRSHRSSRSNAEICKALEASQPEFFEETFGTRGQCVSAFNHFQK